MYHPEYSERRPSFFGGFERNEGGVSHKEDPSSEIKRKKIAEMIAGEDLRDTYLHPEKFELEKEITRKKFLSFLRESFMQKDPDLFSELENFFEKKSNGNILDTLTLIRLYGNSYRPERQEELFLHSLNVFRIVAESYHDVLSVDSDEESVSVSLRERMTREMGEGAFEEMSAVALVHDFGKIALPESIIFNSVTDSESLRAICESVRENREVPLEEAMVLKRLGHFPQNKYFPALHHEFFNRDDERGAMRTFHWRNTTERIELSEEEQRSVAEWLEKNEKKMEDMEGEGAKENGYKEKEKSFRINHSMSVGLLIELDVSKKADELVSSGKMDGAERTRFIKEKTAELLEELKELSHFPIDPNASFGDVLHLHESHSGVLLRILEELPIRAEIASHHHGRHEEIVYLDLVASGFSGKSLELMNEFFRLNRIRSDLNKPTEGIIATRFIMLCDVWEALESERAYKPAMPFWDEIIFFVDLARGMRMDHEKVLLKKKERGEEAEDEWMGLEVANRFIEYQIRKRERKCGVPWNEDTAIYPEAEHLVREFFEEERKEMVEKIR